MCHRYNYGEPGDVQQAATIVALLEMTVAAART